MKLTLLLISLFLSNTYILAQDSIIQLKGIPIIIQEQHYSSIGPIQQIDLGFIEKMDDSLAFLEYSNLKSSASTVIDFHDLCSQDLYYRLLLGENDTLLGYYQTNIVLQESKKKTILNVLVFRDQDLTLFSYNHNQQKLKRLEYDELFCLAEGSQLIGVKKDNLAGVLDADTKLILEAKYSSVSLTTANQLLAFDQNNQRHFFNLKGKEVKQDPSSMSFQDYLDYANKQLKKGKIAPPLPTHLRVPIYRNQSLTKDYYKIKSKGKLGIIHKSGQLLLPTDYHTIKPIYTHGRSGVELFMASKINGDKYYIFNKKGGQISKESYQEIRAVLNQNLLVVGKQTKEGLFYGLIDFDGNELLAVEYKELTPYIQKNAAFQSIFRFKKGKKYYLINKNRRLITPKGYNQIKETSFGPYLHLASKNGKFGYLDSKGQVAIPFTYDKAQEFRSNTRLATVTKDELQGMIDSTGKVVFPIEYKNIYQSYGHYRFKKSYYWGLMDFEGNILAEPIYQYLEDSRHHIKECKKNDKYGMLNIKTGKYQLPPIYDYIKRAFGPKNELLYIAKKNAKVGLLDTNHKVVIGFDYYHLERIAKASLEKMLFSVVSTKTNKKLYGIIDALTNEMIYPCKYRYFSQLRHGADPVYILTEFKNDSIYQIHIDKNAEVIKTNIQVDPNFGYTHFYFSEGGMKKQAWQNIEGEIISSYYDQLTSFKNGWSLCRQSRHFGIVDRNGKEVIPVKYKKIDIPSEEKTNELKANYFAVLSWETNKWGIININGDLIVPAQYEHPTAAWRAIFLVRGKN